MRGKISLHKHTQNTVTRTLMSGACGIQIKSAARHFIRHQNEVRLTAARARQVKLFAVCKREGERERERERERGREKERERVRERERQREREKERVRDKGKGREKEIRGMSTIS